MHIENSKIKICYIASVDITVWFILLNQLKFLKNQGYDVSAVCSPGKWVKDIEKEGIKVKTIKIKRTISPFYDFITLLRLRNYFKKEQFDIIHTHTPKPGLLGQLAAKMADVPIIINTNHGFYFQKHSPYFKRKFFIFIEKIAAKCSDIVFFVNKEDMETAAKEKICKPETIKYFGGGIDLSKFNLDSLPREFIFSKKKELGIGGKKKIIGIVARLVREKGYLDLFKAFKKIVVKFPETILLIIGPEEPEKKDAINLKKTTSRYGIADNVIFLGQRSDVNELYPLMDIFVLPSYREGLGISLVEAQAMEKPVVTTDIRGCRETVENGRTGLLVPVGDPEKLAETIIYLLSNPKKAEEMGKRGREKVLKEFDEKIVFGRIIKEYDRLIKEKIHPVKSPPREQGGVAYGEFNGVEMNFQRILKRIFDFVVALVVLILLSALFLILAFLIKISSAGPVFFRHERVGKNGKILKPFKFRTMKQGAIEEGLGYSAAKKDPRITGIGNFLRDWGIDELPQLINVLKGEMSLVGPRPTFLYQVERYNDFQKKRLEVSPGITGWALIHGRNLLSWDERIKYDVWYVENWSFWLDIKILFKTVKVILLKKGVYGEKGVNDPFA